MVNSVEIINELDTEHGCKQRDPAGGCMWYAPSWKWNYDGSSAGVQVVYVCVFMLCVYVFLCVYAFCMCKREHECEERDRMDNCLWRMDYIEIAWIIVYSSVCMHVHV